MFIHHNKCEEVWLSKSLPRPQGFQRQSQAMDANAGYWSIHLDEASQEISTLLTPFGRYCYKRLPYGVCVSQDRIPARAPGWLSITDNVVMYGHDNVEHDKNLLRLTQVAKQKGSASNSKKCAIKTSGIIFFGSVYGKDGIRLDPRKKKTYARCLPHKTRKICNGLAG